MSKMRNEVPLEETWRLEDIFATSADWEAGLRAVEGMLPDVTRYRGRLHEGSTVLLACLDARDQFLAYLARVVSYAELAVSVDGLAAENQARVSRAQSLRARVGAGLAFLRSELISLPEGTIARYLMEEPGLAPYQPWLAEVMAAKPHALSAETEETLAALGETLNAPSELYQRTTSTDMQFAPVTDRTGREVPVSLTSFLMQIEASPDNALRRRAYDSLVQGLTPYRHTLAANLAGEIKRQVVLSRLRRYENVTQMMLQSSLSEDSIPNEIPLRVYEEILSVPSKPN